MDIPTCWNWFNEVFYREIRRRTCHSDLLLMDNAPSSSKGECSGVFFTPNVTSWRHPCDLGVVAAVKKRYKFLLLKDVLSLHQMDNENQ